MKFTPLFPGRTRTVRGLAFGLLLAAGCSGTVRATDYKWGGGGADHLWSNGQNWSGSQPPAVGVDTTINFAGTVNLQADQNLSQNFVLNSLTFPGGAGAFVVSGGALDFRASTKPAAPALSHAAFSVIVVNNNLVLSDKLTVAVSYDVNSALNAPALTLGGVISGQGSLTFSGSGTTLLSAANTYAGGTIFAGGTVTVGNPGALGGGTLAFNGGTLKYGPGNTTDYSPRFSLAGAQNYSVDTDGQDLTFATSLVTSGGTLTKGGVGTLTLTGNNAFPAGIAISGGVLNVGSAGALGTTGTITFGGTLQYSAANHTDYSGRFTTADNQYASVDTNGQDITFATGFTSARGGFAKLGKGKLTLLGATTSGFATQIKEGMLELPAGGSIANSYVVVWGGVTFNLSGGTVGPGSSGFELGVTSGEVTVNFSGGTLNSSSTYLGYASGSTAIFNQTGGSSNSSMYVGYVSGSEGRYTMSGGTLTQYAVVGYSGVGTFTQNGGTTTGARVGDNTGGKGTYTLNAGTMTGGVFVGSSGTGTFTQNGGTITNGGLIVGNAAGGVGTYNLNGGTFSFNEARGDGGTSTFNFNGGTIRATASRTNFFQGFTTANVRAGGAIIDTNGYNVTAAQSLVHDTADDAGASDGGLVKQGAGTLTLTGANAYRGSTQINAGTLALNGNGTLGSTGNIGIAAAATLNVSALPGGYLLASNHTLTNLGTVDGSLTVASGGTYAGGGTVNGLLTINSGGLIDVAGSTLTVYGGVVNNGVIRLRQGASLVVGGGGTFTNNSGATLDIITGSVSAPAGFTNNGVVIDASVVKAKTVALSEGTLTLSIDGYTGHTYQLRRSDSLAVASYRNVGSMQTGTTDQTLTFTDAAATGAQGFYRVQVDP